MIYVINKTKYEVDNIIYVRKTGDDTNTGTVTSPLLTVHAAVSKCKSNEYTAIDVGKGTFVFTKYYDSNGILTDAYKPIIFAGKGTSTTLVLNQLGYRPTYEARHYKICLGNGKTILTNFVIDINFPNPSGSSWGPNVWNPLFTWCNGTVCNNIFRIKTTTIGMCYYNDSWGAPKIYNNVFAGSYNLDGDYSGHPEYVNNFFIRTPLNGSNSYYSNSIYDINPDIMNGDFSSLKKMKIPGSPNIKNPDGNQSIIGPYGGPLCIIYSDSLYALKKGDSYIIPTAEVYNAADNTFNSFTFSEMLEKAKLGENNLVTDLFDKILFQTKIIDPKDIINYKEYSIVVFTKSKYEAIKIAYSPDNILSKATLSYYFDDTKNYESVYSTSEPYNAIITNKDCKFMYNLNNKESVITKLNIFIYSDSYKLLDNHDATVYKDSNSRYVNFKHDYDSVLINKNVKENIIYSRDSLETF